MNTSERNFVPNEDSSRIFRNAMGCFATGVTIVTAMTEDGPVGMTANSFASVSLDPPMVLWSVRRGSNRFAAFADVGHFAIHVLGAEQAGLSQLFSRPGGFDTIEHTTNTQDVPLLRDCLARFECRRVAGHDGGDHLIIVAQVEAVSMRAGEPLVFAGGTYGRLSRDA